MIAAMPYDPWAVASRIDWLSIFRIRLPQGRGWWLPRERAIAIDDRLDTQVARRCVLAHELEHIHAGDTYVEDPSRRGQQEHRAAKRAACKLVSIDDLAAALRWCHDDHELAEELWVDVETIQTRRAALSDREKSYLDRELWAREEWGAA